MALVPEFRKERQTLQIKPWKKFLKNACKKNSALSHVFTIQTLLPGSHFFFFFEASIYKLTTHSSVNKSKSFVETKSLQCLVIFKTMTIAKKSSKLRQAFVGDALQFYSTFPCYEPLFAWTSLALYPWNTARTFYPCRDLVISLVVSKQYEVYTAVASRTKRCHAA